MIQYISFVDDITYDSFGNEQICKGYITEDEDGYPCNWGDNLQEAINEIAKDNDFAVICKIEK